MLTWIKSWFSAIDRTVAAAERTAKATEDIASAVETARDQLYAKFGIEVSLEPVMLPVTVKATGRKKSR